MQRYNFFLTVQQLMLTASVSYLNISGIGALTATS